MDEILDLIVSVVDSIMNPETMPMFLGGAAVFLGILFLLSKKMKKKPTYPNGEKVIDKRMIKVAAKAAKAAQKRAQAEVKNARKTGKGVPPVQDKQFQLDGPDLELESMQAPGQQLQINPVRARVAPQAAGPPQPQSIELEMERPQLMEPPMSPPKVAIPPQPEASIPPQVQKPRAVGLSSAASRPIRADQSQMLTPIQVGQTQMPTMVKGQGEKKVVTIQDLEVTYEKISFMTPLEISYYKLLRAALKQHLVFPRVVSGAVVKAESHFPDHQKLVDSILSGTGISFVICDSRLMVKAVVEIIDEKDVPNSKDKARDYMLKKSGCPIFRYYGGDTFPAVDKLRDDITASF